MSLQDLSITGSPTPRAVSRRAVSARHQKVSNVNQDTANKGQGGAVITKEKLALAKKLAYYQTEVDQAKRGASTDGHSKKVEEEPVRHHVAGVPPQIRNKPITNKMGTVPPLKLNLLRRPDSAGGYHVTPGLDSSRSVMSWGDDSYRPSQVTRPPPKVSKPSRVEKIADSKNSSEKKDDSDNVENEKINSHTDREARDEGGSPDGDSDEEFTGQPLGFHAYETEEEGVKRKRKAESVESQMIQDLTQPETTQEQRGLYTPWATSERTTVQCNTAHRYTPQPLDSERADFYALKEIPRVKRLDRTLHSTSNELTFDHLQNRGVSHRVPFKVRIISRCARDSLRDLHAFYFVSDGSIAVYEYKEMGKRITVCPLFPRDVYYHSTGSLLGNPYSLRDLKIGSSLHFPTTSNSALPPSITRAPLVQLRVADVSQDDVIDLVHDGCRIEERAEREEGLKRYTSPEELSRIRNLENIQDQIKEQLKARPVRSLVGLGHYFLLHDKDKDGFWRADELQAVLRTFRIKLPHSDFVLFFNILDEDGSGLLDVGEFLRGMLGEMCEARVGLVTRAWLRMDPAKSGDVSFITLSQFYNPAISLDPRADSNASKEELVEEFLECFSAGPLNQKITYCEFVDYYSAISMSAASDEVFTALMKHCWNI